MIHQQPHVAFRADELGDRQRPESYTDRGARDRDRVDRIGLPALTGRPARAGHQLRRHPQDPLTARQQKALQRPGDMPTVLDRPDALVLEAARPHHQLIEGAPPAPHRPVSDRAARECVDRGERVRALVGVRPDHDHLHPSLRRDT
jgi:hypothetical protein